MSTLEQLQRDVCRRFGANYQPCDLSLKVGISRHVSDGAEPLNGVRVREDNNTSGWYIWTGEWSDDPDFFQPLHGIHLEQRAKLVLPYLGLPAGWRFLVTPDYEDVWHDPNVEV